MFSIQKSDSNFIYHLLSISQFFFGALIISASCQKKLNQLMACVTPSGKYEDAVEEMYQPSKGALKNARAKRIDLSKAFLINKNEKTQVTVLAS